MAQPFQHAGRRPDWYTGILSLRTSELQGKGEIGAFGERYGDEVKVYSIGKDGNIVSFEVCGGPHVEHTGVLSEDGKRFKITKEESSSAGIRRIKAVLR